jgi:hypothetical protein
MRRHLLIPRYGESVRFAICSRQLGGDHASRHRVLAPVPSNIIESPMTTAARLASGGLADGVHMSQTPEYEAC